jgi:hypothetical protein
MCVCSGAFRVLDPALTLPSCTAVANAITLPIHWSGLSADVEIGKGDGVTTKCLSEASAVLKRNGLVRSDPVAEGIEGGNAVNELDLPTNMVASAHVIRPVRIMLVAVQR